MKRLIFPLTLLMLLLLTACGASVGNDEPAGVANPWTDCETLDDAIALAHFDITLPESIDGYDTVLYRVMPEKMLEIIYQNDNDEVRIRKAPTAAEGEDISGDYGTYSDTFPLDSVNADIQGEGDAACRAIWTDGDYSFAITAQPGLAVGVMQHLIVSVK